MQILGETSHKQAHSITSHAKGFSPSALQPWITKQVTGQTHLCQQPASYLQVHRYLQAEEECSNRYERLSAGIPTPTLKKFHVSDSTELWLPIQS